MSLVDDLSVAMPLLVEFLAFALEDCAAINRGTECHAVSSSPS